jgi:Transposase
MQSISTIGLDIAKSVFQVHGVDAAGQVVVRRQLRRRHVLAFFQKLPPCLVGIEACASSHHWSRELQALGHTVLLMPPAYVKPYVKRQKNDSTDAEAICEAVTRPNMRFVPTKTVEQQGCLMLHRARHLFIRQQTAVINSIRAYLAEFGIVAPVGRRGVEQLLEVVAGYRRPQAPRGGPCVSCCSRQSIAGIEGPNPGVRPTHHRLASIKRDEQTAGRDPRRRAGAGNSSGRQRCGSQGFPIGTGLLGLGGARAEAELERGQGQAWQYQQARRSLSAQPVHGWRARRHPLCQDPWHRSSALAHSIVGPAPHQGCRYRTRQQTRPDGLGDDGQERTLQGTRRPRGVNEITRESPA